jgi:hypothetical protein
LVTNTAAFTGVRWTRRRKAARSSVGSLASTTTPGDQFGYARRKPSHEKVDAAAESHQREDAEKPDKAHVDDAVVIKTEFWPAIDSRNEQSAADRTVEQKGAGASESF